MLKKSEAIWKKVIWDKWQLYEIWIMGWHWKYADSRAHGRDTNTQKVRPSHLLFLSHFLWTHLRFGCSCDITLNIHKLALASSCSLSVTNENIYCITLLISTGRPDLAAVIMGSSPLACLSCCAAPLMSYTRPNSSRLIILKHRNTTDVQDYSKTTSSSIYGNTTQMAGNPATAIQSALTFICLERSAARIKACRLSNRKSTCCWAEKG